MEADKSAYKQILKATSLFGGVQFINILASIVKTKIAALFIGVVGIGIFGILTSTLTFIQALTRCGIDLTAVKEIASTKKDDDVSQKVDLINKLTLITGIIGVLIVLIFSVFLSELTFGNKLYTVFFITISIAVLFGQLSVGNLAVLQGLKDLKKLAKAITFSSLFSLVPTVALYYFFGKNGIPWVIVITALISFIISRYYVKQLNIKKQSIPLKSVFTNGKKILKSGMYLSLANVVNMSVGFIIQILLTKAGGVFEVGLYNAGFLLINSYVAVFFSSLSKDFFPRLVEVSSDRNAVNKIVNRQAYVLLLLINPIIIFFLVFKEVIVTLLFSKEFLPILGMITYGILATAFKSVSWSMGFIMIAKNNNKLYFKTEIISHITLLISILTGYYVYGLTGLGIGFLVYHILDFIFIKYIVTKNYQFNFDARLYKFFYLCLFQFIIMLSLFYIEVIIIKYSIMLLLVLTSISISLMKLNKHVDLAELYKSYKKNKNIKK